MPNKFVSEEIRATCYKQRGTCDKNGNPRNICHHIDFNHDNNDPENLIWVSKDEHRNIHEFNLNFSKLTFEQRSAGQKKRFSNPEQRRKTSEATKSAMQNPEVRAKCGNGRRGKPAYNKGSTLTPEQRARISAATKAAMQRPEVKAKMHKHADNNTQLDISNYVYC